MKKRVLRKRVLSLMMSCVFILTSMIMLNGIALAKEKTNVKASKLSPVELNWYLPCTPQKDTALVEEALNNYLKDKINATIKLKFVDWGSWNDRYPVLLASGENVDIIFTAGWCSFAQNVARGYFTDLTTLLPKYAPKTIANLPKALFNGAKVDGKIYAIPTSKELAHTYGFLYSTGLANKFGVTAALNKFKTKIPKIQDLEPILKTIKAKDPSEYALKADHNTRLSQVFLDFDPVGDENIPGSLYPNKDTKVIDEYETPEMMATLQTLHKYYLAGYIRKDASTLLDSTSDIKGQKVFLISGNTKPLSNEEVGTSDGYKMDMFLTTKPFITSNDAQGSMNAIPTSCRNPERALMFLELVNNDPVVNNLLNYGVIGKHVVKKGSNIIDFAPGLNSQTTGYNPGANWEFGNQFLNYFMAGQNTTKWAKFKAYNASGVSSKILGFNFDTEPVKTEVAAVSNVVQELRPGLETGTLDPKVYLPQFVKKMKDAGLDKIIAEKQKQINNWFAAKK